MLQGISLPLAIMRIKLSNLNIYDGSRLGIYTPKTGDYGKLILGYRNYELSNHLSNVLCCRLCPHIRP